MSLFYSPREVRIISSRKRKKGKSGGETVQSEMFQCDNCPNEYDSETELHLHRKEKHRLAMNKMLLEETVCKICIKRQQSEDDLLKHIKTEHLLSSEDAEYVERDIYVCDICHLLYFNKQMLTIHILFAHNPVLKKKVQSECPKCGKDVKVKQIWFHFQRHMIQSVACCPICYKKCKSRKELYAHLGVHAYYYHCTICEYDTRTKEYFTNHMRAHKQTGSVDDDLLKRCFIPRHIPRKSNFDFGMRGLRLHNLEICILCRAICTKESKVDHLGCHMVNQVIPKKQYTCVCGEMFFNNVLLKHHVFKLKGDHQQCDTLEP